MRGCLAAPFRFLGWLLGPTPSGPAPGGSRREDHGGTAPAASERAEPETIEFLHEEAMRAFDRNVDHFKHVDSKAAWFCVFVSTGLAFVAKGLLEQGWHREWWSQEPMSVIAGALGALLTVLALAQGIRAVQFRRTVFPDEAAIIRSEHAFYSVGAVQMLTALIYANAARSLFEAAVYKSNLCKCGIGLLLAGFAFSGIALVAHIVYSWA